MYYGTNYLVNIKKAYITRKDTNCIVNDQI